MLSCRDVTKLVSESMDRSLPFGKLAGVRFHLLICRFCERYRRQLLLLRESARFLAAAVETPGEPFPDTLPAQVRERIRKAVGAP